MTYKLLCKIIIVHKISLLKLDLLIFKNSVKN